MPASVTDFKPEVVVIGDIVPPLEEDEIAVACLPPKTTINSNLSLEEFKVDLGMASTKARWERRKEFNDGELSDEEKKQLEEEEALNRSPFDPLQGELDLRKRKVTDTSENSRIYLPKPLPVQDEANINVREQTYQSIFQSYYNSECNEKGKQQSNLSKIEMTGLAKLKKRVDNGTIMITETDKSGKLAILSPEAYMEMGSVHTRNDREIDQAEVDDRERQLNGHVSMLLKITQMGERWEHEDRLRESNIKHSGYAAVLSILVKDHKEVLSTWPVVGANEGIGSSISNILSEIIEPLADMIEETMEINSTEDGISRINAANEKLSREWTDTDKVGLIGFDVKALFQSMSSHNTARVVRDVFLESRLEVRGINYTSAAMYVRYGYTDIEIRAAGLERIVPVRKFTRGRAPGITSAEAKHAEAERAKDKWVFPDLEPTELEKRKLMAAVLEIGVRAAWENSVYQFGGKYYLQQKGGPTGARVTMAASRVVTGASGIKLMRKLMEAKIKTYMKSNYVDGDGESRAPERGEVHLHGAVSQALLHPTRTLRGHAPGRTCCRLLN